MAGRWSANDEALYYVSENEQVDVIIDLHRLASDQKFYTSIKLRTEWHVQGFLTFNEAMWHALRAVQNYEGHDGQ